MPPTLSPSASPSSASTSSPAASLTLAVFAISIFFVLVAVSCPKKVRVPFWVFPLVGCCVLLAAQAVPPSTIWQGAIVGDSSVQPFAILIIFFSLAYMCLSLDASGGLGLLSQWLINQAHGSWFRLFAIVAVLSIVLTVTTSNDVVILTLTPLVIHACRLARIDSTPFLLLQYFLANILSAVLIIGNPTNVVIGVAMNLSFGRFFILMVLPSLVCAATLYLCACAYFRAHLADRFVPEVIDPYSLLIDPKGAVAQAVILLVTICLFPAITMTVPSSRLWHIALAGGLASLFVDLARLPWYSVPEPFKGLGGEENKEEDYHSMGCIARENARKTARLVRPPHCPWTKVPTVSRVLSGVPFGLLPFVCSMFFLVDALVQTGWVESLAVFLARGIQGQPVRAALAFGYFSVFLCNLVNNQPASIMLSRVLLEPVIVALDAPTKQAAQLAVILACNLAATITPIGALAGIMFLRLVENHRAELTVTDFIRAGLMMNLLVCLVGFLVVSGEGSW